MTWAAMLLPLRVVTSLRTDRAPPDGGFGRRRRHSRARRRLRDSTPPSRRPPVETTSRRRAPVTAQTTSLPCPQPSAARQRSRLRWRLGRETRVRPSGTSIVRCQDRPPGCERYRGATRRVETRPLGRSRGLAATSRPRASQPLGPEPPSGDDRRKSTRLNSSHLGISYAVFCLKKK